MRTVDTSFNRPKTQYSDELLKWVSSLFGSVFRWDFRWVLNSDWDQRSAKKWSRFFVWPQRLAERLAETKLRTERSLNPKLTRRWHVTISCQPGGRPPAAGLYVFGGRGRRTRTQTLCIRRNLSRHVTIGTPMVIFAVFTVFWLFLTVFDDWYTVGTTLVQSW